MTKNEARSECPSALDQIDDENHHGDHEQDVNEAAEGVRADKA
jgi:hypothetical protein